MNSLICSYEAKSRHLQMRSAPSTLRNSSLVPLLYYTLLRLHLSVFGLSLVLQYSVAQICPSHSKTGIRFQTAWAWASRSGNGNGIAYPFEERIAFCKSVHINTSICSVNSCIFDLVYCSIQFSCLQFISFIANNIFYIYLQGSNQVL